MGQVELDEPHTPCYVCDIDTYIMDLFPVICQPTPEHESGVITVCWMCVDEATDFVSPEKNQWETWL